MTTPVQPTDCRVAKRLLAMTDIEKFVIARAVGPRQSVGCMELLNEFTVNG
jgi:hypothetical protein